jgi:hypothetical protein
LPAEDASSNGLDLIRHAYYLSLGHWVSLIALGEQFCLDTEHSRDAGNLTWLLVQLRMYRFFLYLSVYFHTAKFMDDLIKKISLEVLWDRHLHSAAVEKIRSNFKSRFRF